MGSGERLKECASYLLVHGPLEASIELISVWFYERIRKWNTQRKYVFLFVLPRFTLDARNCETNTLVYLKIFNVLTRLGKYLLMI